MPDWQAPGFLSSSGGRANYLWLPHASLLVAYREDKGSDLLSVIQSAWHIKCKAVKEA